MRTAVFGCDQAWAVPILDEPIGAAPTYGPPVEVPEPKTWTATKAVVTAKLKRAGRTLRSRSMNGDVTGSVSYALYDSAVQAVASGEDVDEVAGTSTLSGEDKPKKFLLLIRTEGVDAGDMLVAYYSCAPGEAPEVSGPEEEFALFTLAFEAAERPFDRRVRRTLHRDAAAPLTSADVAALITGAGALA